MRMPPRWRFGFPVRSPERGRTGEDSRLLPGRMALRTRSLPDLLERRRRGRRVVRPRLLPARDRSLRRADDPQAGPGAQEESEAPLAPAALPRDPGEALLRA